MTRVCTTVIRDLLEEGNRLGASDIHIGVNNPPIFRIFGKINFKEVMPLNVEDVRCLLYQMLTPVQIEVLEKNKNIDIALHYEGIGRYRGHIFYQRGNLVGSIRKLSDEIPYPEELGLPPSVERLAELKMGLVLVTGPTGSGKSTTLASLINLINNNCHKNIITIEDPIEYEHNSKKSFVSQQELNLDFFDFAEALRGALRADPDVILVGEMRDMDTIRTAITAAETGHLVFSTLHSRDAISSITRMIGVFPPEEQQQIRVQMAGSLKAVISQQLLPRVDQMGRVLATELMYVNPAISNLIRLGKQEQIYMAIETGTKSGMQTMEQSLGTLYNQGIIDYVSAIFSGKSPALMEERIGRK